MATLVIRKLDDRVRDSLQQRAASHGRSMAEEVRTILGQAVLASTPTTGREFLDAIRAEFAPLGGVELDILPREFERDPPGFEV